MKIQGTFVLLVFVGACRSTPFENAKQLANSHEYAGAIELLKAQDFDSTTLENLSLRAVALFAESRMVEGFQDIEKIIRLSDDGKYHAARVLVRAAKISSREKSRARDVVSLLDSAVAYDPSTTSDVVNSAWQRGLEYLNSSGDAGRLYINCAIKYDANTLGRLRAHDLILARRFEEMETMTKALPLYAEYGRKFLATFGKFPAGLLELQTAFPEAGLKGRDGWEITIGGREGRIAAEAAATLGNPYGIKRGTALVGG